MNGRWTHYVLLNGIKFARHAGRDGTSISLAQKLLQNGRNKNFRSLGGLWLTRLAFEYDAADEAIAILTQFNPDRHHQYFAASTLATLYMMDPAYGAGDWPAVPDSWRNDYLLTEALTELAMDQPDVARARGWLSWQRPLAEANAKQEALTRIIEAFIDLHALEVAGDSSAGAARRDLRLLIDEALEKHGDDSFDLRFNAYEWRRQLRSEAPALPMHLSYKMVRQRPLGGVNWTAAGRARLQGWRREHHQLLQQAGLELSPDDLDDLSASDTPQRSLEELRKELPRGNRGWDFPPQVYLDRQQRRKAAKAAREEEDEQ